MTSKKFLDDGTPLTTTVPIMKTNSMIKIVNPENLPETAIFPGAFGRIHSQQNGLYKIWVLDERTMHTIIIEVPLFLMGQYFKQYAHNIFPNLGTTNGL